MKIIKKIRSELKNYDLFLSKKKEIIYFNKSDLIKKNVLKEKLKIILFKKDKIKKNIKLFRYLKRMIYKLIKKVLITNVNK